MRKYKREKSEVFGSSFYLDQEYLEQELMKSQASTNFSESGEKKCRKISEERLKRFIFRDLPSLITRLSNEHKGLQALDQVTIQKIFSKLEAEFKSL